LSSVHPVSEKIIELFNLLQIGFSYDLQNLDADEARYILFFKHKLDAHEEKKQKRMMKK